MNRTDMELAVSRKLTGLVRRWRLLGDQTLAQLGLSNATGWCLLYLSRLGEEASQSDLARAVEVREATLVRTLAQLETAGLIERSPNPKDARRNLMRLTAQGAGIVNRIEELLADLRHQLLGDISDDDLAATLRLCDTLDRRLAEMRG